MQGQDFQIVQEIWSRITRAHKREQILVTFNGIGFDLPILHRRAMLQDISADPLLYQFLTQRYQRTPHFDIMQVMAQWDRSNWKKLDFFLKLFGLGGKTPGMNGAQVYPALKEGRYQDVIDYCRQDIEMTRALFRRIEPWFLINPPNEILVLDIETCPNQSIDPHDIYEFDPDVVKLGNLKDPFKIEAKKAEAEAEFWANIDRKMSFDPDGCQVVCVGIYDSLEDETVVVNDLDNLHIRMSLEDALKAVNA